MLKSVAVGALCVMDTTSRPYTGDDITVLTDLAVLAAEMLELRRIGALFSSLLGTSASRTPALDRSSTEGVST